MPLLQLQPPAEGRLLTSSHSRVARAAMGQLGPCRRLEARRNRKGGGHQPLLPPQEWGALLPARNSDRIGRPWGGFGGTEKNGWDCRCPQRHQQLPGSFPSSGCRAGSG